MADNFVVTLANDEEILYMVTCVFSASSYKSRYNRYFQFSDYIAKFPNVKLYTVELCFHDQEFQVTDPNNPFHMQLRTQNPLWYKENILNILINSLPLEAKKIAVVDCDVQWDNDNWVDMTLKALDIHPVVQMFSTWQNLDENDVPTMKPGGGFAQKYVNKTQGDGNNGFTGLAWAWRRAELNAVGGLIDFGILGSGDYYMANAIIGSNRYDAGVIDLEKEPELKVCVANLIEALDLRVSKFETIIGRNLGYVDSNILHFFHGKKSERGYSWRWRVFVKHNYQPLKQIRHDQQTGLIYLLGMEDEFYFDVQNYFDSRNEDSGIVALEMAAD